MPSLLPLLSASAVFVAVPKVLKKELINVAFLDSLSNHVQSSGSSRSISHSITRSIAHSIALPKICGLCKTPGLSATISGFKCRKSCDNTPSRNNLNIKAAIYIVWRYLTMGLWHWEHSDARCQCCRLGYSENQIAQCFGKIRRRNLQYAKERCHTLGLQQEKCNGIISCPGRIYKGGKFYYTFLSFFLP